MSGDDLRDNPDWPRCGCSREEELEAQAERYAFMIIELNAENVRLKELVARGAEKYSKALAALAQQGESDDR